MNYALLAAFVVLAVAYVQLLRKYRRLLDIVRAARTRNGRPAAPISDPGPFRVGRRLPPNE
jgi:hypothetical protein